MDRQYFDQFTEIVNKSGVHEVVENCNSITFTNIGADIVTVDGKVLFPGTVGSILGDSISIGGNQNEVYNRKIITIAFTTTVNPQLEIIQKYFLA